MSALPKDLVPVDFGQIITDKYKDLTKSEKQIADYLRKNQEEFGLPFGGGNRQPPGFERSHPGTFCPFAGLRKLSQPCARCCRRTSAAA